MSLPSSKKKVKENNYFWKHNRFICLFLIDLMPIMKSVFNLLFFAGKILLVLYMVIDKNEIVKSARFVHYSRMFNPCRVLYRKKVVSLPEV